MVMGQGRFGKNMAIDELVKKMGNLASFEGCQHDDFKITFAKDAEGFDLGFKLKVQEKMSDSVSLTIEQDSVIRVTTHS